MRAEPVGCLSRLNRKLLTLHEFLLLEIKKKNPENAKIKVTCKRPWLFWTDEVSVLADVCHKTAGHFLL